MSRFDPANVFDRPQIQMVPLIDIMFFALIFFMILSVYYHIESQVDIRLPQASQAASTEHKPELVINVNTAGNFTVNGRAVGEADLESLLKRSASSSAVIIRADKKAYHQYVIKVLDICARNNIRDISFATESQQ